jgi:hypothetical protein
MSIRLTRPEAAAGFGPILLQGEYTRMSVDRTTTTDPDLRRYVQASWS